MLAGVFQLDGDAAWRVSREIGLDTFDDMAVASAICRPGPAAMAATYGRNKRNPEALERYLLQFHPIAREIVRPTFGLLIYQEQVMRLARELAGLDWPDVQRLRKEVGDKLGTQPDIEKREAWKKEWGERFIGGCVKQGVPLAEAGLWWAQIQTHGGYSFNKSHAVTYALLSYWMFYLKVHYRDQFYAAYLELEKDGATRKRMVREFTDLGGEVRVIDPVLSRKNTRLAGPGLIVGGWADLYKVGDKTADKIVAGFDNGFADWADVLRNVPNALKKRLEASGLSSGQIEPRALVALAPWYPVQSLPGTLGEQRRKHRLRTCNDMPHASDEYDERKVSVLGFVTAREVKPKYVGLLIEDETGFVTVKVASKKMNRLGPVFRELKLGDLVVVAGWWSGDTLYADSRTMVLPSLLRSAKEKK
jgi:hypothetical protein